MSDFFFRLYALICEMGPYLLLGFFIAGILHSFVSKEIYSRYLSGNNFKSVFLASLAGVPLPLCSCGVIPTAVSMKKNGASRAATVSFLITTPQTGVDSIAATYSLMGWAFAIVRPIAAFITGIFGGAYTGWFVKSREIEGDNVVSHADLCYDDGCCAGRPAPEGFLNKITEALRYGFFEMVQDIGKNLVVGLLIGAAIGILVPDGFFSLYANNPVVNMLLVLVVAVPMYVCATGSIPIAAALMFKGLSPGAALVFLMAGPAINMASVMVIGKTLGRKTMGAYLGSVVAGSLLFGIIVDYLLPARWFVMSGEMAHMCHEDTFIPVWQQLSALALIAMLVIGIGARFLSKKPKHDHVHCVMTFKVEGMSCNHCKENVEKAVSAVEGVASVHVDLNSGKLEIDGKPDAETVITTVEGLGYKCRQIPDL